MCVPRYFGRTSVTRWPSRPSARGSAAATSASPPVFAKGRASEATIRMSRPEGRGEPVTRGAGDFFGAAAAFGFGAAGGFDFGASAAFGFGFCGAGAAAAAWAGAFGWGGAAFLGAAVFS